MPFNSRMKRKRDGACHQWRHILRFRIVTARTPLLHRSITHTQTKNTHMVRIMPRKSKALPLLHDTRLALHVDCLHSPDSLFSFSRRWIGLLTLAFTRLHCERMHGWTIHGVLYFLPARNLFHTVLYYILLYSVLQSWTLSYRRNYNYAIFSSRPLWA